MPTALLSATLALACQEPSIWSLQPLADPAAPPVEDEAWPRDDLDRFILARLEAEGLSPGPDALPGQLLRRLCFDLTGLPPTPAQLEGFTGAPGQYEALVDELLASLPFAERWGRHWLDVARYAESSGGGRSLMFPDAWRYRDYVIDAFERDIPFDRFVLEQLAGDLLGAKSAEERNRQSVATGFLLLGPTNYEQQDKELLRLDVIDEQIDTVGRAFLGQTFGCARCHEHKFDPVTEEDYYALAGIFASTTVLTPGNVSGWTQIELEGDVADRWHAYQAELKATEGELAALAGARPAPLNIDREVLSGGTLLDDSEATLIGAWKSSVFTTGYLGAGYLHDEDRDKGEKSVTWTPDLQGGGRYRVLLSYTAGSNRASNTPVVIEHAFGRSVVTIDQRRPPAVHGWFSDLGVFDFEEGISGLVRVETSGTDGHVIADGLWIVPEGEAVETGPSPDAEEVARLEANLAALREDVPAKPPVAMVVHEDANPRDEPLRIRGAPRELGEPVPRRPPRFCDPKAEVVPSETSGRLQLAEWIVSKDNPLTPRVQANRIWGYLFGEGLVATPDNFGVMGELPTHPLLLDRLARDMMEGGWSTKRMIRRLVLSRSYRLAVGSPPPQDPQNRLRSFYPRRRLDADALRDAMLAASGELDSTRGGSTITKVTQYDYGYDHDSLRRSVYVPSFRNSVLDISAVFDGPNMNMVSGRRGESQVPTQALLLMNSPWVRGRAEALGLRVFEHEGDRLELACRLTLGRSPTPEERDLLHAEDRDGWTAVSHALLACLDFRYL